MDTDQICIAGAAVVGYDSGMTIRAIFDGRAFVPIEPVSLPAQTEVDLSWQSDADRQAWMDRLNAELRADYENYSSDEEDEAWGRFAAENARLMWAEMDHEEAAAAAARERAMKGNA